MTNAMIHIQIYHYNHNLSVPRCGSPLCQVHELYTTEPSKSMESVKLNPPQEIMLCSLHTSPRLSVSGAVLQNTYWYIYMHNM